MEKQRLELPIELHCEIFEFLPTTTAIRLLTLSDEIHEFNAASVQRKWEKIKPLNGEEHRRLVELIRTHCTGQRQVLNNVIQIMEKHEDLAHIRLYIDDNFTIKTMGYREHPITREPRRMISYKLKPITGRALLAYFDELVKGQGTSGK